MIQITTVDSQYFEFEGIRYFKNFTPVVRGNRVSIVNTYGNYIILAENVLFSEIEVNGLTYATVALLQEALLPVIYVRATSGVSSAFLELTDTPSTYTGQAGKVAKVKSDETGLEFGEGGSPTIAHNDTTGRDAANAHPISAITGLQTSLGIYITANTTAVNNGRYIANGTLTVSDIVSPVAGSNYEVVVRGGAVTIDGVAFDAGSTIRRVHNGTAWLEYYFNPLPLIFTGASNLTTSRLWNNRIVKIVNTAPITVTLNDDIECSGNQESILDITFVSGNRVAAAANGTLVLSSSVSGSLFMLSRANAAGTPTTRVYLNTIG